jgi:hypothetical protein
MIFEQLFNLSFWMWAFGLDRLRGSTHKYRD